MTDEELNLLATERPMEAAHTVVQNKHLLKPLGPGYKKALTIAERYIMHPQPPPLDLTLLERQPGENDAAWWWYCRYRDMAYADGPGSFSVRRFSTLASLAANVDERALESVAERWNWRERVRVFDGVIAREALKRTAEALETMKDRQIRLGMTMQQTAMAALSKVLDKMSHSDLDVEGLNTNTIARLAEVGVKVERLSRGETTENLDVGRRENLKNLSDDELEQYRALCAKMG